MPGQPDVAAPHLRAPHDGGRFGQIKTGVVVRLNFDLAEIWLAEILHLALGLQSASVRKLPSAIAAGDGSGSG